MLTKIYNGAIRLASEQHSRLALDSHAKQRAMQETAWADVSDLVLPSAARTTVLT